MVGDRQWETYKLADTLLCHIHHTTHLGTRKMEDLMRRAHLKIFDVMHKIEQIAEKCLACHLTKMDS